MPSHAAINAPFIRQNAVKPRHMETIVFLHGKFKLFLTTSPSYPLVLIGEYLELQLLPTLMGWASDWIGHGHERYYSYLTRNLRDGWLTPRRLVSNMYLDRLYRRASPQPLNLLELDSIPLTPCPEWVAHAAISICCIFMFLAVVSVTLRFATRIHSGILAKDDWLTLASLVSMSLVHTTIIR